MVISLLGLIYSLYVFHNLQLTHPGGIFEAEGIFITLLITTNLHYFVNHPYNNYIQ